MTKTAEPAYRTAHESGAPICPECGFDFTGMKADNVLAHIEGDHPGFNVRENLGDTAAERRDVLLAIAGRLGR